MTLSSSTLPTPADPASRPLTLCVVNFNGEQYLERTLSAARRSRKRFDEILLVDDASSDGSVALVRECFPEVTVLALERNRGPGGARNAGFRAARNDLILFADNDVALEPACAGRLADALASRPDALVAMPRVLYAGQPDTVQYEGADCHYLGLMVLRRQSQAAPPTDEVADTQSVVTCSFLVDRSRWRGGDPFDDTFVFNLEDHDFGVRSRILGYANLAVPAATCLHGEGTPGLSFREGGERSPIRVYCLIRNRWRILLQSYQVRTLVLLAPGLALYEVIQLAGVVRKGWVGSWLRALGWILRNPGLLLRRRREVQQARRNPDRAFLVGGPLPFTPGLTAGPTERLVQRWVDRLVSGYWRMIRRLV